ncbi:spermidine/putrescine ABC transporter substrate-binding protein [Mycoplasma sp. ES3157-GEN-MYC]|uniref:Spermidine/putrescine ABC transporter substrate-binding protein n=1 Tax=Mycoplasma miroungigenitalium TaxID=754515 RepID=A0A6M4JCF0_9MOLU|nr:spermidine/putrescine ABC transporter substrate-binding protein [Mycoplasma miroungigenitalium]MBU4690579.1 spermidine/putrescine ABC transporter substrate-binding protein [Mycoplasma miroungigenitalium]MBU4691846.1 spermidine/putrescine ABC transporter substrate-binding protein [Mycoplasma miroungigenitalium]QJR43706.1 spermidine/putrescine ABC transporter substrate-binding protein [Mycoplasma miroungigenitalium]
MKTKTISLIKKISLGVGATAIGAAMIAGVTYKFKKPFKPTFYNYKSYMSDDAVAIISEKYDFKQFETLNEFTKAILTKKAIGGIGSDAQAVQLIRRDKLKEIDYLKLFGDQTPAWALNKTFDQYKLSDEYRKFQKSLYTDQVWEHLASYDNTLLTDFDGKDWKDGVKRHLYNYFIPYFSQDMVVAYNPTKVDKNLKNFDLSTPEGRKKLYETDQKILNSLYNSGFNKDKSIDKKETRFIDVLKSLRANGYNRWEITDAVRDNMIYGSAYEYDNEKEYFDNNISGNASTVEVPDLYKSLIDNFSKLIQDGTGYSLTDSNVQLLGDGQLLLTNLINDQSNIQAGIIYNGDATDAYFSTDNIETVADGTIRFIRPKSNLLLVDGLVLAQSDLVDEKTYDQLLNTAKKAFLGGLNQLDWSTLPTETVEKFSAWTNFDYVSYTPAFKAQYNYALENKFSDLDDYEQFYAKQLYEIKGNYDIKDPVTNKVLYSYNVVHKAIVPTDQKTQTNLTTYWNQKTKK